MHNAGEYRERVLSPGEDLTDAFEVRYAVFSDEQGFDRSLETDATDPVAYHVVLYDGDRPVATGRLYGDELPGAYWIGRVAVLKECRGGAGKRVMELLETRARELQASALSLSAQYQVRGFYEKLGYRCRGDTYYDEHCLHILMTKPVT